MRQAALHCLIITRMCYSYRNLFPVYISVSFKLSSFDSAVRMGSKTPKAPLLAQPISAPEQWLTHVPSPVSDAWALGALIRFACTGEPSIDMVERSHPPFPYSFYRAVDLQMALDKSSIKSLFLRFFPFYSFFTLSSISPYLCISGFPLLSPA